MIYFKKNEAGIRVIIRLFYIQLYWTYYHLISDESLSKDIVILFRKGDAITTFGCFSDDFNWRLLLPAINIFGKSFY